MDRRHFLTTTSASLIALQLPDRSAGVRRATRRKASGIVMDSLATDGPYFDASVAIGAGLSGAIIDMSMYPRNFNNAVQALSEWNTAFRREGSLLAKVTKADHIAEAGQAGKFAVVLACQDAAILDSSTISVNRYNLQNLALFHELGLRVLQLTHNDRNAVGDSFREKEDAGLSRLGEAVVPEMNQLGLLIDLSHCSRRTTLQAIQLSTRPCAITHAGCKALHPTARNKTDEEIRAVAEKGGYFGVFNMSLWLTSRRLTSIDDVLDHIDHAVKIGGVEHVGFGSDGPVTASTASPEESLAGMRGYYERNKGLPGAETEPHHVTVPELNSPRRLERLALGLARRGYRADAVDKIVGGNIARVLRDAIG